MAAILYEQSTLYFLRPMYVSALAHVISPLNLSYLKYVSIDLQIPASITRRERVGILDTCWGWEVEKSNTPTESWDVLLRLHGLKRLTLVGGVRKGLHEIEIFSPSLLEKLRGLELWQMLVGTDEFDR